MPDTPRNMPPASLPADLQQTGPYPADLPGGPDDVTDDPLDDDVELFDDDPENDKSFRPRHRISLW